MADINDFLTDVTDEYYEETHIENLDFVMINNINALMQALAGEIKTPLGVVKGVGLENYGCEIYKVFGENLDEFTLNEAVFYVNALAAKYDEIEELDVTEINFEKGQLRIKLKVSSIWGEAEGEVLVGPYSE